ncbi:hypothetical protein ASE77_18435 [Sphingomonas sp. Leaf226]|nr:hypothetical protein ASE77_18435 [Sphingomonas sp. Leaf226]
MHINDQVIDGVGDRGVVRKLGHPKARTVPNFSLSDPASVGPTFDAHPATVLVEWETLNGKPAFKQASWEAIDDLIVVEQ